MLLILLLALCPLTHAYTYAWLACPSLHRSNTDPTIFQASQRLHAVGTPSINSLFFMFSQTIDINKLNIYISNIDEEKEGPEIITNGNRFAALYWVGEDSSEASQVHYQVSYSGSRDLKLTIVIHNDQLVCSDGEDDQVRFKRNAPPSRKNISKHNSSSDSIIENIEYIKKKIVEVEKIKMVDCNSKKQVYSKLIEDLNLVNIAGKYHYIDTQAQKNWSEAQEFCQSRGLELASIESKMENKEMGDYIYGTLKREDAWQFWLGGTAAAELNSWVWMGTGRNFEFTDWIAGPPIFGHGRCTMLEVLEDSTHWWVASECSRKRHLICQLVEDPACSE